VPAALRRVLPIVLVVGVTLAAPALATAGSGGKCNASACKVYVEPGVNSGGHHHQPKQHPTAPSTTGEKGNTTTKPPPTKVSRVLSAVGKDRGALSRLLKDSSQTGLAAAPTTVATPSALGSVFDLGSGPNVLLAILVATALGFALPTGIRSWRRRRTSA
jgi:hypothetical protein